MTTTDSVQQNKQIVTDLFDRVWNDRDTKAIEDLFAPGAKSYGVSEPEGMGRDEFGAWVDRVHVAFPDVAFEYGDPIADGDRVSIQYAITGTHEAEFMGIPGTGTPVEVTGQTTYRLEDGQIVEAWTDWNRAAFLEQIGILPEMVS